MSFNLDYSSVKNIVGNADQAMVYGWGHCKYAQVGDALKKNDAKNPIKKVFDWSLGNKRLPKGDPAVTTLEGRHVEQIDWDEPLDSADSRTSNARQCKAGLTTLVYENYKRKKEGKELIPVIFCVDIDKNPHPSDSLAIASREKNVNALITHSELRRCYKLAHEAEKAGLRELAEVARETFKFVKLRDDGKGSYKLEPVKPFWDAAKWDDKWFERAESRATIKAGKSTVKLHKWIDELKVKLLSNLPKDREAYNQLAFSLSEKMYELQGDKSEKPTLEEFVLWIKKDPEYEEKYSQIVEDPAFGSLYKTALAFMV